MRHCDGISGAIIHRVSRKVISRAAIYVWQKDVQKYLGLSVSQLRSAIFFGLHSRASKRPNVGTTIPSFLSVNDYRGACVIDVLLRFSQNAKLLKLNEALENFDNLMSFMIASIDAISASQNAALAAEFEGLGICYRGTTRCCFNK